jgi:release factor glutamine methyltransferase
MITVSSARDAVASATAALEAAGCETPRLDAELLIADALGVTRQAIVADPAFPVPASATRMIAGRVRRRVMREPVAYILGSRGFRRIELTVDRRVLIPRPETELLVEVALELPPGARVHEVGTGSGAVALALLDERPDLHVSASDASPDAIEVARTNAATLGLQVELSVARGLPPGGFDLVVANLPYVREDEWPRLAPEIVRYEPREALVAGTDGLDAIRELVATAASGTQLALEHAPPQAAAVRALLEEPKTRLDLAGRERVTVGRAPATGAASRKPRA